MREVFAGVTFYYDKSNGYMFTFIDGRKTFLHRYIWEIKKGEIPKGYIVHHKDGNKLNNKIRNLECISRSSHNKCHKSKPKLNKQEYGLIMSLHKMGLSRFEISKIMSRSPSTIFDVVTGRREYKKIRC